MYVYIYILLSQYLGKTHNYWNGAALMLEDRGVADGELAQSVPEPPSYDGNYAEEVLNPLKHVRPPQTTLLGNRFCPYFGLFLASEIMHIKSRSLNSHLGNSGLSLGNILLVERGRYVGWTVVPKMQVCSTLHGIR